jgi:hypothetical protein
MRPHGAREQPEFATKRKFVDAVKVNPKDGAAGPKVAAILSVVESCRLLYHPSITP